MVVVKVRGIELLIRCADLVRCPLKASNLLLVSCEQQLDADPHPPMRGDWSVAEDAVVYYMRGSEVPEYERAGYVPHGPTPEPPALVEVPKPAVDAKVIDFPDGSGADA